jgi:hypothetical protein
MSTKKTIARCEGQKKLPPFHFYADEMDDEFVFLELTNTPFEVSSVEGRATTITVSLPREVWDVIGRYREARPLVSLTDEEIEEMAKVEVAHALAQQANPEQRDGDLTHISKLLGYDRPADTLDDLIERRIIHYSQLQRHQQWIEKQVKNLLKLNPDLPSSDT